MTLELFSDVNMQFLMMLYSQMLVKQKHCNLVYVFAK